PPFVANGSPGRFTATASTSGVAGVATFTLANHAAVTTITATSKAGQTATVQTRYRQPLRAKVLDANGQPIEGASVTFTLAAATARPRALRGGGQPHPPAPPPPPRAPPPPPSPPNNPPAPSSPPATPAATASPPPSRLWNLAGAPATTRAGAASGQSTLVGAR